MTRVTMWLLLGLVAASAAVLSFDSLRTLAVLCGYPASLSALFPVTVDAGAAAACLTWLDRKTAATTVGRTLTWTLLVASVGMNGIVHYLDAYTMRPAWWLIVGVSAIPPATLGAVVHLAVLAGRQTGAGNSDSPTPEAAEGTWQHVSGALPVSVRDLPPVKPEASSGRTKSTPAPSRPKRTSVAAPTDRTISETRAAALLASGAGRRRIATELGITEHQARELLKSRNGHAVLEEAR